MAETPEKPHRISELLDLEKETGKPTDVILVCGGKDFPAHKAILEQKSEAFWGIFPYWHTGEKPRIEIPEVSSEEMEIILPFLYKGKITEVDDPSLLKKLMKTSDMLDFHALFEYCYKKLLEVLSCSNWLEIYNIPDLDKAKRKGEEMMKSVLNFLAKNYTEINQSDEFLKLSAPQLQRIVQHLQHDTNTNSTCMDTIIVGLIRWSQVEDDRQDTLIDILITLNLQEISTNLLKELLRERKFIKQNPNILTLLTAEATARTLPDSAEPTTPMLPKTSKDKAKYICVGTEKDREVCRMYDLKSNEWSVSKSIPFHWDKGGMSMVSFGDYIYVVGGKYRKPSANIIKYNPTTNTIVSINKLLIPVSQAGVGILNEFIYVVNGLIPDQVVNTVQCYNPVTGDCKMVAPTNYSHNAPDVLNFSNYLYIVSFDMKIERYDPEFNKWSVVTTVPRPTEYYSTTISGEKMYTWCSAAISAKYLFVAQSCDTNVFQVYDFSSNKWVKRSIEGLPNKFSELHSVKLEGKCVLLVTDMANILHVYDPECNKWIKRSKSNTYTCYDSCIINC